jgi:sugar phosphate isomerase/epimerase
VRFGADDLVLAHWTMAPATFEERCRAAAAGGFAGIGILPDVYRAARADGYTDDDLDAMLASYGVALAELESLSIAGPDSEVTVDEQLAVHWRLADRFGADRLGVVVRPGHAREYQVDRFRVICDEAARRGVRVGIEFIGAGVAAFDDARSTLAFVLESDRPNGGLILDCYHHFRNADDWSQLEELPSERVVMIQLSDARVPPAVGDYIADTMHHRMVPGTGQFELLRFVTTLDAIGADAPWSLEVLSDELAALPPEEQGRRLGEGARTVLAEARAQPMAPLARRSSMSPDE